MVGLESAWTGDPVQPPRGCHRVRVIRNETGECVVMNRWHSLADLEAMRERQVFWRVALASGKSDVLVRDRERPASRAGTRIPSARQNHTG
jgi:hypothetical protein